MNIPKRIATVLAGSLLLLHLLFPAVQAAAAETLKLRFFKIGKADAFLLRSGSHALLIDTGEADDAQEILEYLKKKEVSVLDCLILSHFGKRSAGGAPELLASAEALRILVPDYPRQGSRMDLLNETLAGKPVEKVTEQQTFSLGELSVTVYPALSDSYTGDEDGDFSLAVSVTHGENRFFFAGDMMSERVDEMAEAGLLAPHTLLKLPGHGQDIPGLSRLLEKVRPDIAVITASAKNPPAGAVISLLEGLGIRWYCTMDGSVSISSDGHQVTVSQKSKTPLRP